MRKDRIVIEIEADLKKVFQLNCIKRNKKMSDVIRALILKDNRKQVGRKNGK